ncbi:hypothetical protein QR98_0018890, partial [Sarcoptes scabiei]
LELFFFLIRFKQPENINREHQQSGEENLEDREKKIYIFPKESEKKLLQQNMLVIVSNGEYVAIMER